MIPAGSTPEELTDSVKLKVRTPVVSIKSKPVSCGLVRSGPSESDCKPLEALSSSDGFSATSRTAPAISDT